MTNILMDLAADRKSALLITAETTEQLQKELYDKNPFVLSSDLGDQLHKIFVRKELPVPQCILIPLPLAEFDQEAFILLTKYGIEQSLIILCDQPKKPSLHHIKEDLIHKITTSMTSDIMFYNYPLYEQQKDQLHQKLSEKIIALA